MIGTVQMAITRPRQLSRVADRACSTGEGPVSVSPDVPAAALERPELVATSRKSGPTAAGKRESGAESPRRVEVSDELAIKFPWIVCENDC